MNIHLVTAALASFILSSLIAPLLIRISYRFNLFIDDPKKRFHPANTHSKPIPRAGGLVVFLSVLIISLLFLEISKIVVGILLGGLVIIIIGLLDDIYDLNPFLRLVSNFVISGIVIAFGLGIPYISNPFGGVIHLDTVIWTIQFLGTHHFLLWANLFSLMWIATIMNFVNWSSGVDGQLSGYVSVSSIFLGIFALRFSGYDISSMSVSTLCFIVSGAFAGFWLWNFYPQKIMPGYSGGTLAGYFLAVLSILSFTKFGVLVMLLAIPLIDAFYVVIRRISQKKSPFKGDAGHFHHRLISIGWGKRRIAIFYALISAIYGFAALYFTGWQKLSAVLIATVLLFLFILIIEEIKKNQ
ncbi:MAG: glycosyltransferase family 4 protein [Candidatus Roizmanbacteria bacterium]